jgi:DNA mismatch repair protein MutS
MHETASILRHASPESLIIMDEVGRGTSTRDGLAIAWAVLEYMLNSLGCRALFATHFHELTSVQHSKLANFSLQVHDDGNEVVFLKRVVPGPASNSYGIHVARLAGVPESVTNRAEAVLAWLQDGPAGAIEVRIADTPRSSEPPALTPAVKGQSGLFGITEELELMVRSFQIDQSSPLDALNAIAAWQNSLGMSVNNKKKRLNR